jgi:hypothetical protein
MMPVTLSLPLVLAHADDDASVVVGMASAIPAASAPVTFDFMVSPGIAGTVHDRGPAHRRTREKYGPRYWFAGVRTCGPRRPVVWRCAHWMVSRNYGPAAPAASLAPAELARWINPIARSWMSNYGRFYRSAPYPLLGHINHYMMR